MKRLSQKFQLKFDDGAIEEEYKVVKTADKDKLIRVTFE